MKKTMKLARLAEVAVEIVAGVQRKLPDEIREIARALPVLCESAPNAAVMAEGFPSDILGLFEGPAHGDEPSDHPLPPHIILYLENLWDYAEQDLGIFRDEVRLTYLHELGHYFGWDEDEVAARGLE
jgi:predicted Zn-dependent protease with MMP-like domain